VAPEGGRPDGPQTLNKLGLNRIGDGAMTARDKTTDGTEQDPRAVTVTFVTTEHFTVQGARSVTISGHASIFGASGALAALGLIATAAHVGTAFYAFGLILPQSGVRGTGDFRRVLQTGIEDHGYAKRIARAFAATTSTTRRK
jgi:hypothetical protein